jgi:hypothetical protein
VSFQSVKMELEILPTKFAVDRNQDWARLFKVGCCAFRDTAEPHRDLGLGVLLAGGKLCRSI